jgi:NAD(P)-dependent dehydrogenase (short-subunit alcohol dehydrogenase family)
LSSPAARGLDRFSLAGKRALVTGASRGIGRAIASALAEAGADVALTARSLPELEAAAEEIRAGGPRAVAIESDVLDPEACARAVETAVRELGGIDILVNNAGGPVFNALFLEMREAGWHKVIELNLTSVMRMSQLVGRHMHAEGGGSVVNITSPATFRPWPAIAAYSAAKAAVLNLTQVLAQEWAERGVRVNAISPGWIRTEINRVFLESDDASTTTAADIPLARWGDPDDVVGAVIWLASDAASYVTGAHIAVDGGLSVAVPEDWKALRVQRTWQERD